MKLTYWVAPNWVPGVGTETPAVGMSVTPAGRPSGKMTCLAVVEFGPNGAPPNLFPLNHWPSGIDIPSARLGSELRKIVLDRQVPDILGPLNVSPTAIRTWCSLIGVF